MWFGSQTSSWICSRKGKWVLFIFVFSRLIRNWLILWVFLFWKLPLKTPQTSKPHSWPWPNKSKTRSVPRNCLHPPREPKRFLWLRAPKCNSHRVSVAERGLFVLSSFQINLIIKFITGLQRVKKCLVGNPTHSDPFQLIVKWGAWQRRSYWGSWIALFAARLQIWLRIQHVNKAVFP